MANIAAISTPSGIGAIALIRLSGENVISEFSKVFCGKNLTKQKKNTFTYGKVITPKGEVIDDVIVLIYRAPNSFTGQDMLEITTHGGSFIPEKVLDTILLNTNIRKAKPGEFSKRAYLNKKLDLIQAEAIMALIESESDIEAKIAREALNKKTSKKIKKIADEILALISLLEYEINYPDDSEHISHSNLIKSLTKINRNITQETKNAKMANMFKQGVKVGIIGKPNVGKSSLLNALLKEKRAIVSNIPGTTRDIISQDFILGGIKIKLLDTAGIRKTTDKIEKIGVFLSKKVIKESDIIILVLEGNKKLTNDDYELIKLTKNKKRLIVLNKTDLKLTKENKKLKDDNTIFISSLSGYGIDVLENKLLELLNFNTHKSNYAYLFSHHQIVSLENINKEIKNITNELKKGITSDLAQILLNKVYIKLLELIGLRYNNDIENYIFNNFCIGK